MAEQVNDKQTVLSFQQFSIFDNGGGSRILRRLIEDKEQKVLFFSVVSGNINKTGILYSEIEYTLFPPRKKWMRSFVRDIFNFLRDSFFFRFNEWKIKSKIFKLDFDILHIVDQGKYANILTQMALKRNIPLWVSFHDHFKATGSYDYVTKDLWIFATKRMVISKEMGDNYNQLFGQKPFFIVTDGLKELEISPCKSAVNSKAISIYYGGLLHIAYYPIFKSFCNALDLLCEQQGFNVLFVLRGTQKLDFLNDRSFKVDYRGFTLDNDLLKQEMNQSDFLYLPIKYTDEYFYKFSFSTKMIGYFGASGNIFYHGPKDAAAALFLQKNNCGIICDSLETPVVLEKLKMGIGDFHYSLTAKKVAREHFLLKSMQQLFWL